METLAGSIYKFFDQPKQIIFIRVYAIKSINGETVRYTSHVFGALGDGWKQIMRNRAITKSLSDLK